MNLNALQNFIAIVEAGSIREAADNLHIAQSALSRQVLALEREFGAPLLSRLPRGVEPTPAGRIVLRHARLTLDQVRSARDEVSAIEGLRAGQIRLAAIEPFAHVMLPDCIVRFQKSYPDISFDVRVGNTPQVTTLVQEGIAELGIAYNTPREAGLVLRSSSRQPLVALVSPRHPLADAASVTMDDVARFPAILPPKGSPTRLIIEEAARRANTPLRPIALESDSVALRLSLAQRTLGIAILAHISGLAERDAGHVRLLPITDDMLSERRLDLIAAEGRTLTRATREFERLLRGALHKLEA
ncbi:LysR family transcriptional regulator [Azorhizobium oxalatiphilum]|uniref:LysR family transcriptional regulator n=1 Tax=Azorhizobium oxalatiphilum TaxID=980631 RepID=A0A917BRQ5_9HYPH|nr:LysR family transcriptional regulator [Azorhizobium oxalatiphilum]GGF54409.1 LysR family transcriptional regulator [Azorhizobium oxalatiphilum]